MALTEHFVLGMMSGSSLDGLDLAVCRFQLDRAEHPLVPEWEIMAAETDPFPPMWRARLRSAPHLPGRELWRLHTDLGHWLGQRARSFLDRYPTLDVALAGSHGHTIFHAPEQNFTTQIGDGAALAFRLGLPVVTELRGADVAAGGQGAPLAPLADKYLFPRYDGFLNLGGIANLSLRRDSGDYVAGDISGCCQVLDLLAQRTGAAYDAGGALAAKGSPAPATAQKIAALPYHQLPYPKSLGNAWVRDELWPLLDDKTIPAEDLLHTFTRWLAKKIAYDLDYLGAAAGAKNGTKSKKAPLKILITGGGSHNNYLLGQLRATQDESQPSFKFIVENADTTDFKEAALIALAALFRTEGIPNALVSATGAKRATVNGALFHP
ncbi:anhydro-N-acetylmuramic acid kinase [Neolewinella aurantiaca]|uniref:Anhydro-N-acetylmuramic acid kinase n=1 Tax=Neolewinella aurantiaca TaxID=2602767 RepID=A0A5C7F4S6_9BACT|nr:anhydro-N-acetylmuramic acid kinase [Neolewinella aurantiaca]TXF85661.1 anhydro-N-acetylmuramic acid kinase [Neolewinella aurantiaca]